MKSVISYSVFLAFISVGANSLAQVGLEGFSSGRYEVRKKEKVRKPTAETTVVVPGVVIHQKTDPPAEKAAVVAVPAKDVAIEEKTPKSSPAPVEPAKVENSKTVMVVEEPTIGEQAGSLFSSKAEKIYEFYRAQVHPDDTRNNRVELDVAPVFTYIDSKSNYAFRNYQSNFNALKVRTNVWFTPRIGVSGQFMFSLAADMDSVSGSSRVPTKYEMVDVGVNFRKYFGVSRLSNSVEFSLLFSDNKVNVESENTSRPRLRTNGVGAGIKARIPSSESYAWTVGGTFFPRLQHSETETGAAISSGSANENTRLGFDFGGELKFDRESQVIWSLGVSSEKNMFGGTASLPDPSTGATPSNVSVTNSTYMFSLGYRWGH